MIIHWRASLERAFVRVIRRGHAQRRRAVRRRQRGQRQIIFLVLIVLRATAKVILTADSLCFNWQEKD